MDGFCVEYFFKCMLLDEEKSVCVLSTWLRVLNKLIMKPKINQIQNVIVIIILVKINAL